jgi:hypothetical protein
MRSTIGIFLVSSVLALGATATAYGDGQSSRPTTLDLSAPGFSSGARMPRAYTCEGGGQSPALSWSNVPDATKSFAILIEDMDGPHGAFTQWMLTGIPATTRSFEAGQKGYIAPCPSQGEHHYQIHVYALDVANVRASTRAEMLTAIAGHILSEGELDAIYEKRPAFVQ